MKNSTNMIEDAFDRTLLQHSGLYTDIVTSSSKGAANSAKYILELNGKFRREYPQELLTKYNLQLATLGSQVDHQYFDAGIQCEDLSILEEQEALTSLINSSDIRGQIGSILIAHQAQNLTNTSLADAVINSFEAVEPGGSVYVLDVIGWNNKRELLHEASKAIRDVFLKEVKITRYAIMPVLTVPFAQSIAGTLAESQFAAITREINEKTGKAVSEMHEITLPISAEYNPKKLCHSGSKVAVPIYGNEVLKFRKLTEKEQDIENIARKKRQQKLRDKKRKEKKKKYKR